MLAESGTAFHAVSRRENTKQPKTPFGGMPSLFFMPSFGYGYGYGIGGGYIVMKVLVQMYMMYMIYSYLFGPRGGRGSGSNATGS